MHLESATSTIEAARHAKPKYVQASEPMYWSQFIGHDIISEIKLDPPPPAVSNTLYATSVVREVTPNGRTITVTSCTKSIAMKKNPVPGIVASCIAIPQNMEATKKGAATYNQNDLRV